MRSREMDFNRQAGKLDKEISDFWKEQEILTQDIKQKIIKDIT